MTVVVTLDVDLEKLGEMRGPGYTFGDVFLAEMSWTESSGIVCEDEYTIYDMTEEEKKIIESWEE